jgi:hypothetical protein
LKKKPLLWHKKKRCSPLSDKCIEDAYPLEAILILFDEAKMTFAGLVAVVKFRGFEDNVKTYVEVEHVNRPVELLSQRPGGEKNHAGMVFEVFVAVIGQLLFSGVRIILQGEVNVMGEHWPCGSPVLRKPARAAPGNQNKGHHFQSQERFIHNKNLQFKTYHYSNLSL